MHARHFLSGRGRPSSSAIQSNNCFITGPSRKSFVASIALACSGGKSVSRGGIYLFFLPDSFRDVLSLSIYHCSQKLQPSSHNSVFPPCRITEIRVLFCFRKRQKPAQGYRRNSYLSANAVMLMAMSLKRKQKAIKAAPSCTDQKAADPYCRGRERSTAVCGLPCPVRFGAGFRADFRFIARHRCAAEH